MAGMYFSVSVNCICQILKVYFSQRNSQILQAGQLLLASPWLIYQLSLRESPTATKLSLVLPSCGDANDHDKDG